MSEIDKTVLEFMTVCQVLQSDCADFEKKTWTFTGETMLVSGGDYVVVPKGEFHRFVNRIKEAAGEVDDARR